MEGPECAGGGNERRVHGFHRLRDVQPCHFKSAESAESVDNFFTVRDILTDCRGTSMQTMRDEFLSEEDLDLRSMSQDELFAYWNLWLEQAQASNDLDRNTYSHGVFVLEPAVRHTGEGEQEMFSR